MAEGIQLSAPSGQSRSQIAITARGLISETFHPGLNGSSLTPANQEIYGTILGLRAGDVVTNIVVNALTAAAGTAPTSVYLGLYSKAGVRRGLTVNEAANAQWAAAVGYKSFALTTPYVVPADDGYFPVFLQNGTWGTTQMQLNRGINNTAAASAVSGSAAIAVKQVAQATLPDPATFVATGNIVWFGVN